MSATDLPTKPESGRLNGRHVLAILLGFFGFIFAVNGYFAYAALSTYTGIVANEPYRKGLAYNQRIEAEERQNTLNWVETAQLAGDGTVVVTVAGADGHKVQGLAVTAVLSRPATDGFDHRLKFGEAEPGRYTANAGALAGGTWVIAIEARQSAGASEPDFRARRRLWLRP